MKKPPIGHISDRRFSLIFILYFMTKISKSRLLSYVHQLMNEKNKLWYIHKMEYYPAIRKNKILIYARTWMNLENLTLSKRSPHITWFHLCEVLKQIKLTSDEINQSSGYCLWGVTGIRKEESFWGDRNILYSHLCCGWMWNSNITTL